MTKVAVRLLQVLLIPCLAVAAACGKDDATAKLAFTEANPLALTYGPSNFKMKLIAAYLSEGISEVDGSNLGMTSRFYEHPTCAGDLMHCDISAGTAEDGAPMDKIVSTYFDFSPGVDVNAALNAQNNPVSAGSYRYVRLEFCKYNHGGEPNVQWGGTFAGNTVTDASFNYTGCAINSAEIVPPLDIVAGDAALVTLAYSVAGTVSDSGPVSGNCATAGGATYCFTVPTFTPSAHLE